MGVDASPKVFSQGMQDALEGKAPAISQEEIKEAMKSLQASRDKEADETLKKGEAFLAVNKTKKEVKSTPSGLQYKVIKAGAGANPKDGEIVKVNYRGTFIDGKEFDNTAKQGSPAEFTLGPGIIEGWNEALKLMNKGAKYEVYIPAKHAQGLRGIPKNSALIFEIELLDIKPAPPASMGGMMGGMNGASMPSGHPAVGKKGGRNLPAGNAGSWLPNEVNSHARIGEKNGISSGDEIPFSNDAASF